VAREAIATAQLVALIPAVPLSETAETFFVKMELQETFSVARSADSFSIRDNQGGRETERSLRYLL
jgi:type IV secretory pathway component VirB8